MWKGTKTVLQKENSLFVLCLLLEREREREKKKHFQMPKEVLRFLDGLTGDFSN